MKKHLLLFLPLLCWFGLNILPAQNGCLPDGITFTSQEQIDAFPSDYPGCTEIGGSVRIFDSFDGVDDISNVDSLYPIATIGGHLYIGGGIGDYHNHVLENLHGLKNLTSVQLILAIDETWALSSLEGLESLTFVGTTLLIQDNLGLTDLQGLESLVSVNSSLGIVSNSLTSLEGLDALDYTSMTFLIITENENLSICEIPPVCAYLENGGNAVFFENAPGCNTEQEINDACQTVAIEDLMRGIGVQVSPNPTSGIFQITIPDPAGWEINVRDAVGRMVLSPRLLDRGEVDLSGQPKGLYFIELTNGWQSVVKRVVVQ